MCQPGAVLPASNETTGAFNDHVDKLRIDSSASSYDVTSNSALNYGGTAGTVTFDTGGFNDFTISKYDPVTVRFGQQSFELPAFSTLTDVNETPAVFGLNLYQAGVGNIRINWGPTRPDRRKQLREQTRVRRQNHQGRSPRAYRSDFSDATPAELTALQLLRQLVGQDEFRRYLRYGFIVVQGMSGLRYQIDRKRHNIVVWADTGKVDNLCCYLRGDFPPTDSVITRMLMAERDELELWRRGNSRAGRDVTFEQLQALNEKHDRLRRVA